MTHMYGRGKPRPYMIIIFNKIQIRIKQFLRLKH